MTKKQGYSRRMEQKLGAWRTRFEKERAQAELQGSALKPEIKERLEAGKVAGDHASAKLNEMREVAARWASLRDEMEKIWTELEPFGATDIEEEPVATPVVRAQSRR